MAQNNGIRWIMDEHWPAHCPIDQHHKDLKLEKIDQRIMRLAKDAWAQIEENDEFFQETCNMDAPLPHHWFPSSRDRTL